MVPDRSPGSGGAAIVNTGTLQLTDWKFNSNTLDLNAGTLQFITYRSVSKTTFLLDEVLIPVKHLANGTTIAQIQVDAVIYYHVELPAHDVVLAESYLETGDRANFANAGAVVRQFPDFSARAWEALECASLVVTGRELAAARSLISGIAEAASAAA